MPVCYIAHVPCSEKYTSDAFLNGIRFEVLSPLSDQFKICENVNLFPFCLVKMCDPMPIYSEIMSANF